MGEMRDRLPPPDSDAALIDQSDARTFKKPRVSGSNTREKFMLCAHQDVACPILVTKGGSADDFEWDPRTDGLSLISGTGRAVAPRENYRALSATQDATWGIFARVRAIGEWGPDARGAAHVVACVEFYGDTADRAEQAASNELLYAPEYAPELSAKYAPDLVREGEMRER